MSTKKKQQEEANWRHQEYEEYNQRTEEVKRFNGSGVPGIESVNLVIPKIFSLIVTLVSMSP